MIPMNVYAILIHLCYFFYWIRVVLVTSQKRVYLVKMTYDGWERGGIQIYSSKLISFWSDSILFGLLVL